MRFSKDLVLSLPILLASTLAQGSAVLRRSILPGGPIVQPASNTTLTPGQPFDFNYTFRNSCESGYSTISVFLLENQPTPNDVTSFGNFTDFLYSYGNFMIPNFGGFMSKYLYQIIHSSMAGLPPQNLPNFPPPPATLSAPTLAGEDGKEVYFVVVEWYSGCPVSCSPS